MAQITSGIRSIFSHPVVYDVFQNLMGAKKGREFFSKNYVRANPGDRVLDIGCGTAQLLAYLPETDYWGFDISEDYISAATRQYGKRGHFVCKILDRTDLETLPKFDVVIASGLLHHLDAGAADELLHLAKSALATGGRLVTNDPCFAAEQNFMARLLVSYDRGQNVLDAPGYTRLASAVFGRVKAHVRHQAWIPYTQCVMECSDD